MPSNEPRKRRPAAERYQQILDASTGVFYEKGYSDSSIQEIADTVGILKGSLYYYINSKEDLLFDILNKVHEDVDAILGEIQALVDATPLEKLREYVYRIVLYNTRHLPSITVYYHEVDRLQSEQRARIMAQRREHEVVISDLIKEAQDAGDSDPSQDARLLRNLMFGALIWVYRWFKPDGRVSDEALADACADFVLYGIVGHAPNGDRASATAPGRSEATVLSRP